MPNNDKQEQLDLILSGETFETLFDLPPDAAAKPDSLESTEWQMLPSLPAGAGEVSFHLTEQTQVNPEATEEKSTSIDAWKEKIKQDFNCDIPNIPAHLLLDGATIYQHLRLKSRLLASATYRLPASAKDTMYNPDDPALFQHSLDADAPMGKLSLIACFYKATKVGNLQLVKWLISTQRVNPSHSILRPAAKSGNLALVQYLVSQQINPCSSTLLNSSELIECLSSRPQLVACLVSLLPKAAKSGNLEMVRWLVSLKLHATSETLNAAAARSGHLELVKWLMSPERGADQLHASSETLYDAARSGNLELLKWVMSWVTSQEGGIDKLDVGWEKFFYAAARSGNLEVLKYLISLECAANRWNASWQNVLHVAAESGSLELVEWLISSERGANQLKPNFETVRIAAASGSLEAVKCLMSPKRDLKQLKARHQILESAAASGNLESVKWLMSPERDANQLHPNWVVFAAAASSGNLELVQWLWPIMLLKQETEGFNSKKLDSTVKMIFGDALNSYHLPLIKWLQSVIPENLQEAITQTMVTYLRRHRGSRHFVILEWAASVNPSVQLLLSDSKFRENLLKDWKIPVDEVLVAPNQNTQHQETSHALPSSAAEADAQKNVPLISPSNMAPTVALFAQPAQSASSSPPSFAASTGPQRDLSETIEDGWVVLSMPE